MAGASAYLQAQMLNWAMGGATPTRPTKWAVGLSLGTPSSISGSEMSVAGYTRQTCGFAVAGTPASSATVSNSAAILFTINSACTIVGINVWDTVLSSNSGNLLGWGTLSASSVFASGDVASFSVGAILLTLA
jgi:hypothetical protein